MECKDCSGEGPTPEVEQPCTNRLLPPTPRCGTHRQTTAVCLSQAGLPHSPSLGSGPLCSCCQGSWETHDTVRRYGREREMTEQKGYMPCALSLPSIVDSIQAPCATVNEAKMAAAFSTFVTSCAIAVAMPSTQDTAEAVGSPKMLRANLPSAIISVRAYLRTYKVCTKHTNNIANGNESSS